MQVDSPVRLPSCGQPFIGAGDVTGVRERGPRGKFGRADAVPATVTGECSAQSATGDPGNRKAGKAGGA